MKFGNVFFLILLLLVLCLLLDSGSAWRRRRRRRRRRAPVCHKVNCKFASSGCSTTCGAGVEKYVKTVTNKCGGTCVQPNAKACNLRSCPIDCKIGSWGNWGQCSTTCGATGKQTRTRPVLVSPLHGGKACPAKSETKSCRVAPEQCKWKLGSCSATCGKGVQVHTLEKKSSCLTCKQPDNVPCYKSHCPVHCTVSGWSAWGACSNTCGTAGKKVRTRKVVTKAKHGGFVCPALSETKSCRTRKEKCVWRLGKCSVTMGRGWKTYSLVKGSKCETCKRPPNKVCFGKATPCVVSAWSRWSKCIGNYRERTRKILKLPKNGGKRCPVLKLKKRCLCRRRNCSWKWGSCQKHCHSRFGLQCPVVTRAAFGGACYLPPCRINRKCHFGDQSLKDQLDENQIKKQNGILDNNDKRQQTALKDKLDENQSDNEGLEANQLGENINNNLIKDSLEKVKVDQFNEQNDQEFNQPNDEDIEDDQQEDTVNENNPSDNGKETFWEDLAQELEEENISQEEEQQDMNQLEDKNEDKWKGLDQVLKQLDKQDKLNDNKVIDEERETLDQENNLSDHEENKFQERNEEDTQVEDRDRDIEA